MNTIQFYNTMNNDRVEVLRISKDGITANPDVPVDEAAQAILRVLDTHLKTMRERAWVGLTTKELDEIEAPIRQKGNATIAEIYRAIEAKLKEKNT